MLWYLYTITACLEDTRLSFSCLLIARPRKSAFVTARRAIFFGRPLCKNAVHPSLFFLRKILCSFQQIPAYASSIIAFYLFNACFSSGAKTKFHIGKFNLPVSNDTTMAGHYSLRGDAFKIEVVSRPNVTVSKFKGKLFTNGELQSAEGYAYKIVPQKDSQLLVTYRLYVRDDSTFIEAQQTGRPITVSRFPGRGMIANGLGASSRYFLPFWGPLCAGRSWR